MCFSPALDWDQILERAKCWGWERGVYLSLRLAAEFVGAEISQYVLNALEPRQDTETIYTMVKVQTFANDVRIRPSIANYTQLSAWKKVGMHLRRFFPSKLEMANHYQIAPDSFAIWLKCPLRWKYLFAQYWGIMASIQGCDAALT